jgi:Spy/CpxP family protein refolding chaperone
MLAFAMLLPASVLAEGKQKGKIHPMKEMWAQLGLTPEQETKLKELHKQTAPARREQFKKIEELRGKIKTELLKDKPSKKVLDDYATQMGNLHKQMNLSSIDHLLKVKAILTPEQFKKFTEKGPMGGPGAHMRGHRGEGTHGSMKGGDGEGRMRKHRGNADCEKGKDCCKKKGEEKK